MDSHAQQNGSKRFSTFVDDTSHSATPAEVVTSSVRLRDSFRDKSISDTRKLNLDHPYDPSSAKLSELSNYIDLLANPDPSAVHNGLQYISSAVKQGFLFST